MQTEQLDPQTVTAATQRTRIILHPDTGEAQDDAPLVVDASDTITAGSAVSPEDAGKGPDPLRTRRKRSDAGITPAAPSTPVAQPAGFLSAEQAAHLDKLKEEYFQAIEANTKAERAMLDASAAWYGYLDKLQGLCGAPAGAEQEK